MTWKPYGGGDRGEGWFCLIGGNIINSGLYSIINKLNGKTYIGITRNASKRWAQHKNKLLLGYKCLTEDGLEFKRNTSHHNRNLQKDFNYYYSIYKELVWDKVYSFNLDVDVSPHMCTIENLKNLEDMVILNIRNSGLSIGQLTNCQICNVHGFEVKGKRKSNSNYAILYGDLDKIKNMYYNEKLSFYKISDEYDISVAEISKFFQSMGLKARDNSAAKLGFDLEDYKDDIINKYVEQNIAAITIGREYNVCCSAITDKLKRWGVTLRTMQEISGKPNLTDYKEEILQMYFEENMSTNKIASKYNVSSTTVKRYFKKWNVKCKSGIKDYANNAK